MSAMNEREKAFEAKFGQDQEMTFKAEMRRNRKLGVWAGSQLGLSGDALDSYIEEVIEADFEKPGDDDVVEKVLADFINKGVELTENRLRQEMQGFLAEAKAELLDSSD